MPLVRVFATGRPNQPESVEEFYDEYTGLKQKQTDHREGVKKPYGPAGVRARDLTGAEKARLDRLEPHAKSLVALHKQVREVYASKITRERKRDELERINTAILNEARSALGRPAMR